jgi:hypothetical protein
VTVINDPEWEPGEIAALREAIHPLDHRIFFGALNPRALAILPEGDLRDRHAYEAWATGFARALETPEKHWYFPFLFPDRPDEWVSIWE